MFNKERGQYMNVVMQRIFRYLFLFLMAGTLIGCGTTAKQSDTPAAGGGGNPSQYLGTATLSGSVVVTAEDATKVQDQQQANSLSVMSYKNAVQTMAYKSAKTSVLSTMKPFLYNGLDSPEILLSGEARLYILNSDGTTSFTGITANLVDSRYTFPGIKDGVQYIVEIVRIGYDQNNQQNILKLKAPAYVPAGDHVSANAEVSPKTKYAVDMIMDRVVKKAQSKNIDQATIDLIVQIVSETITDLLSEGKLNLPPSTEPYVASENATVALGESSAADKAVMETIASDADVQNVEQQASATATLSKNVSDMTDDEIKSFFSKLVDGAPDVFLSEFAKSYRAGRTVSISKMIDSYYDSLTPIFKLSAGHDDAAKTYLKGIALTNVKTVLNALNTYNELATTNIAVYGVEKLRDVVPYISAIFPPGNVLMANVNTITATTEFNVPQGLLIFSMIMPTGKDDMGILQNLYSYSEFADWVPNLQDLQVDGDNFDPLLFCSNIGWMTVDAGKVYISDIEANINKEMFPANFFDPGASSSNMNNGNWVPGEFLNVRVGLMLPPNPTVSVNRVEFEYTDSANVLQTVILVPRSALSQGGSKGGMLEFSNNAWEIKEYFQRTGQKTYNNRIIRSFKAGEGTIRIKNPSGVVLATEKVTIVKPDLTAVNFVYPKGPDMALVAMYGWDSSFAPSELDVNAEGKASPRFQWEAPEGTVPAGYSLAYAVDLRKSVRKYDPSRSWTPPAMFGKWEGDRQVSLNLSQDNWGTVPIWSSWNDGDRLIYSTEFTAPQELEPTTRNMGIPNYQTLYEFVVTPVLVKDGTDRTMWQGAQSNTQFYVGSRQWTIALKGKIAFPSKIQLLSKLPAGLQALSGIWKVALFKMSGNEAGSWMRKDYYGANDSPWANRAPVSQIVELGNMDAVANDAVNFVDYVLPAIKKSQNMFLNNSEYDLVLWYDISTTNRRNDELDVTRNTDSFNNYMIKYREPQFRFGAHIEYRDGRLEYWVDGAMNMNGNKDLTNPEFQYIDLDLASKIGLSAQIGQLPDYIFPPRTDTGIQEMLINANFMKDGEMNQVFIESFWDPMTNAFKPLVLENMHYVKLIREWDKKVVATADAAAVFSPMNVSNRLEVSMNAFSIVTGNALPYDSYSIWIYDSANPTPGMQPIIRTSSPYVDSWFMGGEKIGGTGYTPGGGGGQQVIMGNWKMSGRYANINLFQGLNKDVTRIAITNTSKVEQCAWDLTAYPFYFGEGMGDPLPQSVTETLVSGNVPADFATGAYFMVGYDEDGGIVFAVRRDGWIGDNPYEGQQQQDGDQQQEQQTDPPLGFMAVPGTWTYNGDMIYVSSNSVAYQIRKLALVDASNPNNLICEWNTPDNMPSYPSPIAFNTTATQPTIGSKPGNIATGNYKVRLYSNNGTVLIEAARAQQQNQEEQAVGQFNKNGNIITTTVPFGITQNVTRIAVVLDDGHFDFADIVGMWNYTIQPNQIVPNVPFPVDMTGLVQFMGTGMPDDINTPGKYFFLGIPDGDIAVVDPIFMAKYN